MADVKKIATREAYGMALAKFGDKYDIVVMDATADIEKIASSMVVPTIKEYIDENFKNFH